MATYAGKEFIGVANPGPHEGTNYFTAVDISGSAVASPASVSNSATTTVTCPHTAAEMIICSSGALRISEIDNFSTTYFTLPANTVITIPVATMNYVYLRGDSGTVTVQFMFKCI